MIQRIQSLFLLIAVGFLSLLYFFPLATIQLRFGNIPVEINGFVQGAELSDFSATKIWFAAFTIVLSAVILLLAGVVLSYKNRRRQLRLCTIAFFLNTAFILLLFLGLEQVTSLVDPSTKDIPISYQWVFYMPLASLILINMAMRRIRKDEALVRESDRLR
ncbi:MAG: DUF4293 domain-containing protein [Bacteroidales bacterium]|jgi:hypothetical protein|nr:DUF4293 domain-containing protein [Bacteroidales bacterium]